MSLLVKKASDDEKAQLFRMVHDTWPHHRDMNEHVRLRLKSVQHKRPQWFVGVVTTEDGRNATVACGLGIYENQLVLYDVDDDRKTATNLPVAVIGAVYTAKEHRRKGRAADLIRRVMETYEARGVDTFLLYSDIGLDYYEKLGFRPKRMILSKILSSSDEDVAVVAGAEIRELPLTDYGRYCKPSLTCMISRDEAYVEWLFAKMDVRLFQSGDNYTLVGKYEGDNYVLESSFNDGLETFVQTLAAELKLPYLLYWGKLERSKHEEFKVEIPMFKSGSIDTETLIEQIILFPIDHV